MLGLSPTSGKLLPVDQHDTECPRHVPAQTGSALGRGEAVCHGQRRSQHNSGQAPKWHTTQNISDYWWPFLNAGSLQLLSLLDSPVVWKRRKVWAHVLRSKYMPPKICFTSIIVFLLYREGKKRPECFNVDVHAWWRERFVYYSIIRLLFALSCGVEVTVCSTR